MAWEYCSFELPAKERVRSRSLSFVAVTPGDCIKSLATLELPTKQNIRARNLNFIALPLFTESKIAQLTLPAKNNIRARSLNFVAVNLECSQEAPGIDCVPIFCDINGEANFGDFAEEQTKSYNYTSSYNDDDSFGEYIRTASGSSSDTVTMAVKYARNMFFDPDDTPIKVGTSGGTRSTSSSANQSAWYFIGGRDGTRVEDDNPNRTFSRSSSSSEDVQLETNAQSYTYPRKEATISCSREFYPVDFIGKYRYGIPWLPSYPFFRFGGAMSSTGFTAGSALFTNNHMITRFYSQSGEVNRWNWSSYNFKDRITFNAEEYPQIDDQTKSMEYLEDPSIYVNPPGIYGSTKTLQYNFTDNRGVLSPISFYSKNADVTLQGETIDISRVPVPCSYIAKAIIKLDGKTPNRCGVSFAPNTSSTSSSEGILDTSHLRVNNKAAQPWVWFHHYRGAASIGHQWWQSHESYEGVYYNDLDMDQGNFSFSQNLNITLQNELGLVDHSVSYPSWSSGKPKLHDATNAYHFCLQLGPIYQKKYNTDLDLPATSDGFYGAPAQSHPDYKNPDYSEYKYIGFGWGLYLIDYFHRLDDTSRWDIPPTEESMPVVHGPFCYSTHLSEFFEWTGPEWVTSYEDYYEGTKQMESIAPSWTLESVLGQYVKFKDKNYEDVDELNNDIETKFLLTPDKASLTKSTHYSAGAGILNYAHAIADFTSSANVDQKYYKYNESSLYLNPFSFTKPTPLKNRKNPLRNWNFKDIFIYDRGNIINGGDEYPEDQTPENVELVTELIGKPIEGTGYPFSPCDYVELNWNFTEEAYLHSVNKEKSTGSDFKTMYGDYAELQEYSVPDKDSGYAADNPNALFNYPEEDYFLPYGKVTVEEIEPNNIEGLENTNYKFKLTFDWEQPEDDKGSFLYNTPFISESRRFQKTSYILDFDITEPFVQRFYLPGYDDLNLMITNVNPNAWAFWLNRLYDLRSGALSDPLRGTNSYEEIMMYPRPTFVDVDQD